MSLDLTILESSCHVGFPCWLFIHLQRILSNTLFGCQNWVVLLQNYFLLI